MVKGKNPSKNPDPELLRAELMASTALDVATRHGISRAQLFKLLAPTRIRVPGRDPASLPPLPAHDRKAPEVAALIEAGTWFPSVPEIGTMLLDSVRRLRDLGEKAEGDIGLQIKAETNAGQMLVSIAKLVVSVGARPDAADEDLSKLPAEELMRRAREAIDAHGTTTEGERNATGISEIGDRNTEVRSD